MREMASLRELRERITHPRDSAQGRTKKQASNKWWPLTILRPGTTKYTEAPGRRLKYSSWRYTERCVGSRERGIGWWLSWPSAAKRIPSHTLRLSRR